MKNKAFLSLILLAMVFIFGSDFTAPAVLADTTHCGTISANETWSSTGNVHRITCSVTIASGATLTVAEGAVVKFDQGMSLLVHGTLRVLGTSANPVHFTSIHDDTVGGDTNNNGPVTSPAPGNWYRIEFGDNSNDANSLIEHAVIRYGGGNTINPVIRYGAITLLSASPTIRNSTIRDSLNYGIIATTSTPTLDCNNIYENSSHGIFNTTTSTLINAENQWWGSASGPLHAANPGGTGDRVTDGVDYTPWLQEPCVSNPESIPGDLNGDGKVDIFDYNIMIQNYGSQECGNIADINGDCDVDIFDYNILVQNYGKSARQAGLLQFNAPLEVGPDLFFVPSQLNVMPSSTNQTYDIFMDTDGFQVSAAVIEVSFNPENLTVTAIEPADVLPVVLASDVGSSTAMIAIGSQPTTPLNGVAKVATITFDAGSTAAITAINFTDNSEVAALGYETNVLDTATPGNVVIGFPVYLPLIVSSE